MKISILQPNYLPWIGYFDLINRVDTFVVYDDVQYDRGSWRNRNKIKTQQGWQWLTVPVRLKGKFGSQINSIQISNIQNWKKKHLRSIELSYKKAPFFEQCIGFLSEIYHKSYDLLIDLDMEIIFWVMDFLGIKTSIVFSSQIRADGNKTDRVLAICKELGATHYLSTNAASAYIQTQKFAKENVGLEFQNYIHPVYRQLYGDFIGYLSVVDLLFNHGPESLNILLNKHHKKTHKGHNYE